MKNLHLNLLLIFLALSGCQGTVENNDKHVSNETDAEYFSEERQDELHLNSIDKSGSVADNNPIDLQKDTVEALNHDISSRKSQDSEQEGDPIPSAPVNLFQVEESDLSMWPDEKKKPSTFGFGNQSKLSGIATKDIDEVPGASDLPAGSGTVSPGKKNYIAQCMVCHGPADKVGPSEKVMEQEPDEGLASDQSEQIIRPINIKYWPYTTTIFNFINAAMPHSQPGSLQPDEVYSLVAFLLHENEIIPADAVLNAQTLPQIQMPVKSGNFLENK